MHLADALIPSDFSGYTFIVSMRVPWELNPRPFALVNNISLNNLSASLLKFTFFNRGGTT